MSFVDDMPKNRESKFRRTEFMTLPEGLNVVRVVQPRASRKWTHYINTSYVECLGSDNCSICKNNKRLMMEYPDNYKDEKGFSPLRRRYYVNVVDRTPGVICSQCSKEHKINIPAACECGNSLAGMSPTPLNKIKVLAGGPTLFEDSLNALEKAILDATTQEPLGITSFDISLVVKGSGKERSITPIPQTPAELDFDVTSLQLFDLDNAIIRLNASEMLDFQRGVSLKDLFAARNANSNTDAVVEELKQTMVSESTLTDIQSTVSELFKAG